VLFKEVALIKVAQAVVVVAVHQVMEQQAGQ